jgi:hypothetical protein
VDKVTNKDLFEQLQKMQESSDRKYVTKPEFLPIKLLVYGATAMILTSVVAKGLSFLVDNVDIISIARAIQ